MKISRRISGAILVMAVSFPVLAGDPVGITPNLMSVTVMHNGAATEIVRNQDNANTVNPAFAKTSRKCPPFCIQPSSLAPGVETIGEREIIAYAKQMSDGDDSIVVVDSRTPNWENFPRAQWPTTSLSSPVWAAISRAVPATATTSAVTVPAGLQPRASKYSGTARLDRTPARLAPNR